MESGVSCAQSDYTRRLVVQLDLTNNKLPNIQSLVGNGFLWLRELKLTGVDSRLLALLVSGMRVRRASLKHVSTAVRLTPTAADFL